MSEWKEVFLIDYYDISSGLSKPSEDFGTGFPFLAFKDVFWNYFVPDKLHNLVNSTEKERMKCSVKKGDIFLTRTSEKAEELGMSCVALKDYEDSTFNGFTKRLRPKKKEEIDEVFIGFYLRSVKFRNDIAAFSNLITRASLNNDAIGRLKILLPSMATQVKIGSILLVFSNLIENNLKRIKLLEELAQRTYEEWFVKFRINGKQLEVGENGLPDGWEYAKIDTLLDKIKSSGKTLASEINLVGKFPVVDQSRDFIAGYVDDEDKLVKSIKPIIIFGDHTRILKFINFPFVRGADGTQVLLSNNEKMPQHLFYQSLLKVDLSNYHYARHFKFLKECEVLLPTIKYANEYENLIKPKFDLINNLRNQNCFLKESRDILLPRLMSGKIGVGKE